MLRFSMPFICFLIFCGAACEVVFSVSQTFVPYFSLEPLVACHGFVGAQRRTLKVKSTVSTWLIEWQNAGPRSRGASADWQ